MRDPSRLNVRGFGRRKLKNGVYKPRLDLQLRERDVDVICHSAAPLKLSHKVLDVLLVLDKAHVRQAKVS